MPSIKEELSNKKARMQVEMHFRRLLCLRLLKRMALTPVLAELVEMKKKLVLKSGFSRFVMNLDNGTPSVSDQSCGVYLMAKYKKVRTYVYFQSATGLN